jgi:hypothetical protein
MMSDMCDEDVEEECYEVKSMECCDIYEAKSMTAPSPPPSQFITASMAAPSPPPSQSITTSMMLESMSALLPSQDLITTGGDPITTGGRITHDTKNLVLKDGVYLNTFIPSHDYLTVIQSAPSLETKYQAYIAQRDARANPDVPFFVTCAHYFSLQPRGQALSVRILTSIADLKLADPRSLRTIAYKLWQEGAGAHVLETAAQHVHEASPLPSELSFMVGEFMTYASRPSNVRWSSPTGDLPTGTAWMHQARWLFQRVGELKENEPQSHRELALVQAELGEFQVAVDGLWPVIETAWEQRFQHIADNVFIELNRTLRRAREAGVSVDHTNIPEDFKIEWKLAIAVCIAWDTDDTCLDLHVKEPSGEVCSYANTFTGIGGWSTPDYSGCPGCSTSMLREYTSRVGAKGRFTVSCNFYSNAAQNAIKGSTLWCTIYKNLNQPDEAKVAVSCRLEKPSTGGNTESQFTLACLDF